MRWRNRQDRYVAACSVDEIAVGEIRRVRGLPAILCRTANQVYAVALTCPHAGAQLIQGRVVGDCLECPRHGARFALGQDAEPEGGTYLLLPAHDVKVSDGMIYVSRRPRRHIRGRWDKEGDDEAA
jgi:3-phenylpropionate/trans-cinnamate dioxygenase ferredoxin subunit